MQYSISHKKSVKRIIKGIHQRCFWPLLSKIEKGYLIKHHTPAWPPIFIIGPPRCGSTLLYQLITRGFNVCYLTNFMVYFATSPVLVSRLIRHFDGCVPPEGFDSWYGITRGWTAPHQGPEIWERWFEPGQEYAGAGSLAEKKCRELSTTVALIEKAFNAPFVNKWQGHSVHILPLVEAMPNLLFIRVHRDNLQIAQSILKGRLELRGTSDSWTSVRPSQYKKIKNKHYIHQVCEQIYFVEKDIDRDSATVGKDRFYNVDYKRICKQPRIVIQKIAEFYSNYSGYNLNNRVSVPEFFPYSDSDKVPESEIIALKQCLNRLYNLNYSNSNTM